MLQQDRDARWDAHQLAESIDHVNLDPTAQYLYIGRCCFVEEEDVAETVIYYAHEDSDSTLRPRDTTHVKLLERTRRPYVALPPTFPEVASLHTITKAPPIHSNADVELETSKYAKYEPITGTQADSGARNTDAVRTSPQDHARKAVYWTVLTDEGINSKALDFMSYEYVLVQNVCVKKELSKVSNRTTPLTFDTTDTPAEPTR